MEANDSKSRKEILLAGLKGFERLVELEKKGRRSVNRSRRENYETRMLKKYGAKKNWFKDRKNKGGEELN